MFVHLLMVFLHKSVHAKGGWTARSIAAQKSSLLSSWRYLNREIFRVVGSCCLTLLPYKLWRRFRMANLCTVCMSANLLCFFSSPLSGRHLAWTASSSKLLLVWNRHTLQPRAIIINLLYPALGSGHQLQPPAL